MPKVKLNDVKKEALFVLTGLLPNEEVADLFGVSKGYVSNIKNGHSSVRQQRKLEAIRDRLAAIRANALDEVHEGRVVAG